VKRRRHSDEEAEINITPMLDIVFIMLIFFIVTTSFVKEQGLEVSRPSSVPPKEIKQDKGPIVVRISSGSLISVKGRILEPGAVEALVTILDAAKAVGIESVSVATSSQ